MTITSPHNPTMLTDTENDSTNPEFGHILSERLSRREMLKGSFGAAATLYFGSSSLLLSESGETRAATGTLKLNFAAVSKTLDDKVTLAQGYSYRIISSTGDPLAEGIPAYSNNGSERAESFNKRVGDHHDGMHFFGLGRI